MSRSPENGFKHFLHSDLNLIIIFAKIISNGSAIR